jgi:hypothetical protein
MIKWQLSGRKSRINQLGICHPPARCMPRSSSHGRRDRSAPKSRGDREISFSGKRRAAIIRSCPTIIPATGMASVIPTPGGFCRSAARASPIARRSIRSGDAHPGARVAPHAAPVAPSPRSYRRARCENVNQVILEALEAVIHPVVQEAGQLHDRPGIVPAQPARHPRLADQVQSSVTPTDPPIAWPGQQAPRSPRPFTGTLTDTRKR